jgi:hypothetical protein|tara:strand:+ start:349 stop:465 length:117 start_codon:yes stop_codon:yes gene_type:complete
MKCNKGINDMGMKGTYPKGATVKKKKKKKAPKKKSYGY